MANLNFITAFLFGVLAFFSPCTFPLVPSFLSFLLGISVRQLEDDVYTREHRREILFSVLSYMFGASLVLVFLGSIAGSIGYFLREYRYSLQQIGGVLVVFFGLFILDAIPVRLLYEGFAWHNLTLRLKGIRNINTATKFLFAAGLGIVFTLGWIPCISPILGSILVLASSTQSALYGAALLFVYAIGLNMPLLLGAFLLSSYMGQFRFLRRHLGVLRVILGILMVTVGLILIFGGFSTLQQWAYNLGVRLNI